ncbi:MAG TPA: hypothetical protein IAB68_02505 [Candidatus Aphodocola excrementigallinarum]|uniref:ESAT-6-like protein n=1 Tax=Candidatus Aphodocola excrementigallinarum TaxID=2840670 RepID=A0A9D1IMT0_9FIRM|nr:hypothetical protein [Candidatus Aphodocola excrementigallinarum]
MKIAVSDKLNQDATSIKENIDKISDNINLIKLYLDVVNQSWQGDDATSFLKKYDDVLVDLKKYESELNNYYTFLSKVYDIYDALKESYDKPITD